MAKRFAPALNLTLRVTLTAEQQKALADYLPDGLTRADAEAYLYAAIAAALTKRVDDARTAGTFQLNQRITTQEGSTV